MMRSTFVLFAVCALLAGNAHAQGARPSAVARLANGKPNFSGVWQSLTTANWNLLTHGATAGPPAYGALLATPPGYGIVDGDEIPYLPAAALQQQRNYENRWKEDPELKCFMPGVPRIMYIEHPFQIFQEANHVAIAFEWSQVYRLIYTDGSTIYHRAVHGEFAVDDVRPDEQPEHLRA